MPILEPGFYGLWGGKQTAKGTPLTSVTTGLKRYVQVAGGFALTRDDGEENYSDLTKYGSRTDWVNNVLGTAEPGNEGTPEELAHALWLFHGGEVVSAVTGPPTAQKHTFTPSTGRPHWATYFTRLGLNVIQRQRHIDCLTTRIQIEGSTANKALRFTPRILSLDPFETSATDPTTVMPVDKSFLYTDGTGLFTIDGAAYPGHSQFTFVIDEALAPGYGDSTRPFEVVQGTPTVTIGCTILLDSQALGKFNTDVYGTASPAAGTKPLSAIPALGSYECYLKQRDSTGALNGREFRIRIPSVKWTPPASPGPNPDGGSTEIALAGALRPSTIPYTIDVNTANGVVAFTV
jgi:hypothetical protein